jgi:hypothetical protein
MLPKDETFEEPIAGERITREQIVLSNGNKYEGQWNSEGRPDGKGKMTYTSGNVYIGEFKNGFKSGNGVLKYATGDTYKG